MTVKFEDCDLVKLLEWYSRLNQSTTTSNNPGGFSSPFRTMSMLAIAQFEAVNSIPNKPKYKHLYVDPDSIPSTIDRKKADPLAAASVASCLVLNSILTGGNSVAFHTALQDEQLNSIPDGDEKTNGIALGNYVGQTVIAARSNDGWPPANSPAPNGSSFREFSTQFPWWQALFPVPNANMGYPMRVKPFVLPAYDDPAVEIPPPVATNSETFKKDWIEMFGYGTSFPAKNTLTPEKIDIAQFYGSTSQQAQASLQSDMVLQLALKKLKPYEILRFNALTMISVHDSHAGHLLLKYKYNQWRAMSAYRLVGGQFGAQWQSGDPEIDSYYDPNWKGLGNETNDPEYPSGNAARMVPQIYSFQREFGNKAEWYFRPFDRPQMEPRKYTGFDKWISEFVDGRVYGGRHWRYSADMGVLYSKKVTDYVHANVFTESKK